MSRSMSGPGFGVGARIRTAIAAGALTIAGVWLASGIGTAARARDDAETQRVDAGGATFQAPKSWKSTPTPPGNAMRRAQLTIPPSAGDADAGELVVFGFPGDAGGVEANVERWRRQFQDDNGNPPEAKTRKVESKAGPCTVVELAGRYVAPIRPGDLETFNKENYAMLGAIAILNDRSYFIRLVGPRKTLEDQRAAFVKLVESIEAD